MSDTIAALVVIKASQATGLEIIALRARIIAATRELTPAYLHK